MIYVRNTFFRRIKKIKLYRAAVATLVALYTYHGGSLFILLQKTFVYL